MAEADDMVSQRSRQRGFRSAPYQGGGRGSSVASINVISDSAGDARSTDRNSTTKAVVSQGRPSLTEMQAKVFERIAPIVSARVMEAREQDGDEFLLMRDWEWPDLMRGLGYRSANIVGNVREGMLPVWQSVEALVERHGYRVAKAAYPWRLIGRR